MKAPFYIYDCEDRGYYLAVGEGYTNNKAKAFLYTELPPSAVADDGTLHSYLEIVPASDEDVVLSRVHNQDRELQLTLALSAALEWIDAVPKDTVLPTMPGFDRDWADSLIKGVHDENV